MQRDDYPTNYNESYGYGVQLGDVVVEDEYYSSELGDGWESGRGDEDVWEAQGGGEIDRLTELDLSTRPGALNAQSHDAVQGYVVAMYPSEPSIADELPLHKGQVLALLGDRGEWWKGRTAQGAVGYFPKVYTKKISAQQARDAWAHLAPDAPPPSASSEPKDPEPRSNPTLADESKQLQQPQQPQQPKQSQQSEQPQQPQQPQPQPQPQPQSQPQSQPQAQQSPSKPVPTPPVQKSGKAGGEKTTREKVAAFMDSIPVTIFMLIATVYVLFVDDLVTLVAADRSDGHDTMVFVFLILKVIVFFLFLAELVVTGWADRAYLFSFFFWLDVVALISLIPDVLLLFGYDLLSDVSGLTVARTGRVARASARAARLVRVVRVIKITRFIGQNRGAAARGWLASAQATSAANSGDAHALGPAAEAAVNTTTNKLTAVVLVMFLAVSLMQTSPQWVPHAEAGLWALETALDAGSTTADLALRRFVALYPSNLPVLAIRHRGADVYGNVSSDVWKHYDLFLEPIFTPGNVTQAYFLAKNREQIQAAFNISLVILIILILAVGTVLIGLDAKALVHAIRQREAQKFHAQALEAQGRNLEARAREHEREQAELEARHALRDQRQQTL